VAPCFYGIDMSTVSELFAPGFMQGPVITAEEELAMARFIGADSLHYLPVEALSSCVGLPAESLCRACVNGVYPTPAGEALYQKALQQCGKSGSDCRTDAAPQQRIFR
jgi:amidophosphoribosyltransferase